MMGFAIPVLYYNYPYSRNYSSLNTRGSTDPRVIWIINHRRIFVFNQSFLLMLFVTSASGLLIKYAVNLPDITIFQGAIFILTLLLAVAYYKSNLFAIRGLSIRGTLWLKPLVIGVVWSGLVFILPVVFTSIIQSEEHMTPLILLLFLKSVLYIGILAVLFDIKDVQSDKENKMDTMIVRLGIKNTLFFVFAPLLLLESAIIFANSFIQNLAGWQIFLIILPIALLIVLMFFLRKKRGLLFYLIGIDGLMLIKALCGIIAYSSITFS